MRIYKKRWIQSSIVLICSLAIMLSVFPSSADDIESLEGQSSDLEIELQGINEEIEMCIRDRYRSAAPTKLTTDVSLIRDMNSFPSVGRIFFTA